MQSQLPNKATPIFARVPPTKEVELASSEGGHIGMLRNRMYSRAWVVNSRLAAREKPHKCWKLNVANHDDYPVLKLLLGWFQASQAALVKAPSPRGCKCSPLFQEPADQITTNPTVVRLERAPRGLH